MFIQGAEVSVYKYVSAEGGIRFLRDWELRVTPPEEFNDPFELRPPAGELFTSEYLNKQLENAAPQMMLDDLTQQLRPTLKGQLTDEEIGQLVTCLLPGADAELEQRVKRTVVAKIRTLDDGRFEQIQHATRAAYPALLAQARIATSLILPKVNAIIQQGFLKAPAMIGVLCLSRNANQPLMWAHYAASHRGLLIEFDETHPAFHRKRSAEDEFGYLRPVLYSELRPKLSMNEFDQDNAFEVFALTKSHHWSYEEESRLLWPLRSTDRTIEASTGSIGLISCPPAAVQSVTLGCKAREETLNQIRDVLALKSESGHIEVRRARLDDVAFELTYLPASG
jgi:hypothetical protein